MPIKTISCSIFLTSFLFFQSVANAYSISGYRLIQLDDYTPNSTLSYSYAHAINNNGEVAGESLGYDSYHETEWWPNLGFIPLKWSPDGSFQKLGFIKTDYSMFGLSSVATAINDHGVVVGQSGSRAFIWDQTNGIKEIEFINATDTSLRPIAINNNGTVVGFNESNQYFFWDAINGHKLLNTNNLEETTLVGVSAINSHGVVVGGVANLNEARSYAALGTQSEGMTQLFDLPNLLYSGASDVNDKGQVVGSYTLDAGEFAYYSRPFLWDPAQGLIDLDVPDEFRWSHLSAISINNNGTILGLINGSIVQGFVWDDVNGFRLLSSLVNPLVDPLDSYIFGIIEPVDINDHGQILFSSPSFGKQYILSPVITVPEPESLGMLLAGVTLVSIQRRRNSN